VSDQHPCRLVLLLSYDQDQTRVAARRRLVAQRQQQVLEAKSGNRMVGDDEPAGGAPQLIEHADRVDRAVDLEACLVQQRTQPLDLLVGRTDIHGVPRVE